MLLPLHGEHSPASRKVLLLKEAWYGNITMLGVFTNAERN